MNATFGTCSDDTKVVSKTFNASFTATCTIKEETELRNPTIWIGYNAAIYACNYCYVDLFQRYYYIADIQVGYDQTMNIYLREDVLMSWRSYILNLSALIYRQENVYQTYIIDPEILTRCDKVQQLIDVGEVGLENNLRYYLVTTGGSV